MKLKRLTLENFRGFEQLELDFHPRLTVLVGVNGSGKTSILDAIVAILGHATGGMTSIITEDDAHIGRRSFFTSLTMGDPTTTGSIKLGDDRWLSWDTFELASAVERHSPVALCAYPVRRDVNAMNLREPAPKPSNAAQDEPTEGPIARQWLGMSDSSEFFAWFLHQENIENEHRRDQPEHRDPALEATRQAIERLMPGYRSLRVRRARAHEPRFTLTKQGQELDFNQLGNGEQIVAALVGDIARRTVPDTPGDDPASGDGIVLIDEIDLHLHPKWQANILPALLRTFPDIQFIVTTHSPIVLSHVDSACVRLLEDFALVDVPPTRGRDPNSVLSEVFEVPLRPAETQTQLDHIAELIDEERLDEAKTEIHRLSDQLGSGDVEVTRLGGIVELMEA